MDNQEDEVGNNINAAAVFWQRGDFDRVVASINLALDVLLAQSCVYVKDREGSLV